MQPNGDWNKELVHENNRYKLSEDKLALRIENVMYEDRGIILRGRKL